MGWKTVKMDLGAKYELEAPNEGLEVWVTPMLWTPGSTSSRIMARLAADEEKIKAMGEGHDAEVVAIRSEGLFDIFPNFVDRWNLKDPTSGEPVARPRDLEDPTYVRSIPFQIVQDICDMAISYGQPDDEPIVAEAPEFTDPDGTDAVAAAIPLRNDSPLGVHTLTDPLATAPSSNSGVSIS